MIEGWTPRLRSRPFISSLAAALAGAALGLGGCRSLPPSTPLAQLTPQQAAGRQVFEAHCARCHYPDSKQGLHGPGLFAIFRKPYLPSGAPANDERVTAVILHGRNLMPALGRSLDDQQLQNLLAYLHSL